MRTAISFPRAPWRMPTALVASLAVHAVLLSIAVGGQAFGLPGLTLPWQERRVGADDLRIELAPAPVAPVSPPAPVSPLAPVAAPHNVMPPAPLPAAAAAVAAVAPPPAPVAASAPLPAVPTSAPVASEPDPAVELARVERDAQNAQLLRETELIAIARRAASHRAQRQEEAVRAEEAARAVARAELERQDDLRRAALQQERAAEQTREQQNQAALALAEAGRRDAARQEQARQAQVEEAKQASARAEQARQQEVERQAQQERARQEQAKQELARQQQARQEQVRQEQARQEQAKQEQARQELARQEQAKQELARQEQAKQAQAKPDQAQRERAEQEAQREERLRAIGRQLNAEAAQRDAAAGSPSRSLLPGVSSLRRGWLFGRADANAQLVQYAETMGQKIELNMTFDTVRDVIKQPHVAPIVTIAIRADGSVEKVTFEVSSGVPAIDAAIRRVIASQAPYAAFPPALARQYDVVEIRRTWNIDTAIRLQ
ncbi:MAG TPA: TonB C-terminal domain-containing protein [Telluria sp.]